MAESSNVRKRNFVAAILEGKTQTQAAIQAGYSPARAAVTGSELMKDAEIIRSIAALLDAKGISREKCCEVIARHIDSENDAVSLKATEMALKLHGTFRDIEAQETQSKESFEGLCQAYWATQPKPAEQE